MSQVNQILFNRISKLPIEKVGKAMSFIRFLEQEEEPELLIDAVEEDELYSVMELDETIDSSELLAKIEALPND